MRNTAVNILYKNFCLKFGVWTLFELNFAKLLQHGPSAILSYLNSFMIFHIVSNNSNLSHAQNASPKNGNTSKSPLIKMLTFFIGFDKLIYVPIVFREHPTW